MSVEEWKSVVGWEGRYEVSSLGQVKSLQHTAPHNRGGRRVVPERLLSPVLVDGYATLTFYGVKKVNRKVHQLVVGAFLGPCSIGYEVDHINEVRDDNRLVNLRYLPRAENSARVDRRGEAQCGAKLTENDIRKIRDDPRTSTKVSSEYHVHPSTIRRVRSRKGWGHVT